MNMRPGGNLWQMYNALPGDHHDAAAKDFAARAGDQPRLHDYSAASADAKGARDPTATSIIFFRPTLPQIIPTPRSIFSQTKAPCHPGS